VDNEDDDSPPKNSLALKFIARTRKVPQNMKELPKITKPDEPDFSAEPED
jgi:cyclic nucleotide gated channel, plant